MRHVVLWALLATSPAAWAAAAGSAAPAAPAAPSVAAVNSPPTWIGWDLGCDTQRFAPGDPASAWARIEGDPSSPAGGGTPLGAGLSLLLLLEDVAYERAVQVDARSIDRKVDFTAHLNGHPLGTRTARRNGDTLTWPLPADAIRRGPNVLRLEPARMRNATPPRLIIDSVGVEPRRCRPGPRPIVVDPRDEMTLRSNSVVFLPAPPAGATIELSFVGDFPATAVSLLCYTPTGVNLVAHSTAGTRRRVRQFTPMPEDCVDARGLALRGEGPLNANHVRAAVLPDERLEWRRRVRLESVFLVFLALGAVTAGALLCCRILPVGWAPWGDAAAVFLAALGARLGFYALYPHAGQAGDSFEYMLNAGFLIDGSMSLWSDWAWHSWGNFLRPPGYYVFLAVTQMTLGRGVTGVVLTQLVLSALVAALTYLVAYPLFGRLAACCAGLLFAVHLMSITTYSRILAEPLFMALAIAGLAAIAWMSARPGWRLALAAGVLLGLAAHVRSGPIYYPILAGILLVPSWGWKKALRMAAIMIGALFLTILPWSMRNNRVFGPGSGLETISVAALLLNHPDERILSVEGLDLEEHAGYSAYMTRVRNVELSDKTRRKGWHLRRIAGAMLRQPGAALRRFGGNVVSLLGPVPDAYFTWVLDDRDAVRVARITSHVNGQFMLLLAVAAGGFLVFVRHPRCWPVAAWFLFNTTVLTAIFHPLVRYRMPNTPVLMVFAGALLALWADRVGGGRAGSKPAEPLTVVQNEVSRSSSLSGAAGFGSNQGANHEREDLGRSQRPAP